MLALSGCTATAAVERTAGDPAITSEPVAGVPSAPVIGPAFLVDVDQPYAFRTISERRPENRVRVSQVLLDQAGRSQVVVDWKCQGIVRVEDFDNDGLDEALIRDVTGCGGNCCSDPFFFVDVMVDGTFVVTEQSTITTFNQPVVEFVDGGWTVTVTSRNEGRNTDLRRVTQVFALAEGRLVVLEEIEAVELPAIAEMRSSVMQDSRLEFDIDGDGLLDAIVCGYWERWGSFANCGLDMGSNVAVPLEMQGKRIGVLASTTNGWHDLISGLDVIYVWEDGAYVLQD